MSTFLYTYRNEFDVVDVGRVEAGTEKEGRGIIKQAGIKPISFFYDEGWVGFEFAFKFQTKFRYRISDANNNTLLMLKIKDWRFFLALGIILSLCACGVILSSAIYYLFSLYFLLSLIPYCICYELDIEVSLGAVTKRKKFMFWKLWKKKVDVTGSNMHLETKIACWHGEASGFEKLYVTQFKWPDRTVAISSSCLKANELEFAKTISEKLSLPLLVDGE